MCTLGKSASASMRHESNLFRLRRSASLDVRLWIRSRLARRNESSSYSTYSEYFETWMDKFFTKDMSTWFCHIPDEFLENDDNFEGLEGLFPKYQTALAILRGHKEDTTDTDEELADSVLSLFFLIHQRHFLTKAGLMEMRQKYEAGVFGSCPRMECHGQYVIAAGANDAIGRSYCCIFCPLCKDIYYAKDKVMKQVDGAAFGTSFAPLFFRVFPELMPEGPVEEPRLSIMGFKIHDSKKRSVR